MLAAAFLGCGADDAPRFGPPGGLRVRSAAGSDLACELGAGVDTTGATCPDWPSEIFPLFDGPLACARGGCHGVSVPGQVGAAGLTLVAGDATASYAALASYAAHDRPYVREGAPDEAYILCNLDGTLGTRMPIAPPAEPLAAADRVLVGNWVACGMHPDGAGGAGGGP